jgi:hypothetical protein
MQLLRVCELAKTLRKSRNQIRGIILKRGIKPVEKRVIHLGLTNYYNLEDFTK